MRNSLFIMWDLSHIFGRACSQRGSKIARTRLSPWKDYIDESMAICNHLGLIETAAVLLSTIRPIISTVRVVPSEATPRLHHHSDRIMYHDSFEAAVFVEGARLS